MTVPAGAQAPTESLTEWQHRLTPYLWFTGVKGTLGAGGRTVEADISFSELLENLDLEALAADQVHEFAFVFSPLRLRGATRSPGNPIAVK